jgi:DNA-binding transcriptional MerR regulator
VRAIRHYHEVGLLAEPERRANGYKSYGVAHLVRVLRIKRLIGLGLSLAQIAELGDADEHPEEALRVLDAELAATIERLQRVRVELALILSQATPTDLPPQLGRAVAEVDLSATDRAFFVVFAQVVGPRALDAYAERLRAYSREPVITEFNRLPADADEQTRQELAERLVPFIEKLFADVPDRQNLLADAPRGVPFALNAINLAIHDLYNPAQIDVVRRMTS